MKKLYQDEQWNVFNNMMLAHLLKSKLVLVVDERVDREVILSQIQTYVNSFAKYFSLFCALV